VPVISLVDVFFRTLLFFIEEIFALPLLLRVLLGVQFVNPGPVKRKLYE
jgi:hypothetical protein